MLIILRRAIQVGAGDLQSFPLGFAILRGRQRNLLDDQIDRPPSPEFRHAIAYLRLEPADIVPHSVTNRGHVFWRLAFGPKPVNMQHLDKSAPAEIASSEATQPSSRAPPGEPKKIAEFVDIFLFLAAVLHLQDINEKQKPAIARPRPFQICFGKSAQAICAIKCNGAPLLAVRGQRMLSGICGSPPNHDRAGSSNRIGTCRRRTTEASAVFPRPIHLLRTVRMAQLSNDAGYR